MSLITTLFRLTPPSFRANFCPKSWQELANALIGGTQVTMLVDTGSSFFNYGNTTPLPENRIFPWLNTTTGKWYTFQQGLWTTPYSYEPGPNGLRLDWEAPVDGTGAGLWTFGGGDGSDPNSVAPTAITGSFWTVDMNYAGRCAIGPGTVPVTSNPSVTVAVGDVGGEGQHLLSATEGAQIPHSHLFGLTDVVSDDAFFSKLNAPVGGVSYNGFYITGSNGRIESNQTTADLQTLNNTITNPLPHNNLPPYRVAYKIKRTARVYQTLPA